MTSLLGAPAVRRHRAEEVRENRACRVTNPGGLGPFRGRAASCTPSCTVPPVRRTVKSRRCAATGTTRTRAAHLRDPRPVSSKPAVRCYRLGTPVWRVTLVARSTCVGCLITPDGSSIGVVSTRVTAPSTCWLSASYARTTSFAPSVSADEHPTYNPVMPAVIWYVPSEEEDRSLLLQA